MGKLYEGQGVGIEEDGDDDEDEVDGNVSPRESTGIVFLTNRSKV